MQICSQLNIILCIKICTGQSEYVLTIEVISKEKILECTTKLVFALTIIDQIREIIDKITINKNKELIPFINLVMLSYHVLTTWIDIWTKDQYNYSSTHSISFTF